jgi:hypothetical protein
VDCFKILLTCALTRSNLFLFVKIFFPVGQLHTFPEGKVSQEDGPIRRLKWGTASLIVRAPVTPIVLPIVHHGFEEVVFLVLSPILSTLSL